MTALQDDWGHDPSVQGMRRVFSSMERAQEALLDRLGISLFDSRLRSWRDQARTLFERTWTQTMRQGAVLDEEDISSLYLHSFVQVLTLNGVSVPIEIFSRDERVMKFFREGPL